MTSTSTQPGELLTFAVDGARRVSARLLSPPGSRACYVLAHGAGAGMEHRSMIATARGLATLGIATLRFQFPYMEQHMRRPDPPALCHAAVRAAVREAARLAPALPLFAGGRSFGGRMTSQAQALEPLPAVRGLVFLAFPLHPAGRPSDERARHLDAVRIPMLFVQGTRDALAERDRLLPLMARLGARATLHLVENADHSFHVPAKLGKDDEVQDALLLVVARWMESLL